MKQRDLSGIRDEILTVQGYYRKRGPGEGHE